MKKALLLMIFFIQIVLFAESFTLELDRGWNLISTPIDSIFTTDYMELEEEFIYGFSTRDGVYEACTVFTSGTGYFVLSRSEQTVTLSGDIDTCIDYPELLRGWNMGGAEETKGAIIGLV